MGWFKFKNIQMPKFVMLENEPSPLRFEQVTSIIDMPDNTPLVYQTKGFKSQTISLIIGFRPGVWDTAFMNQYSGANLTDAQYAAMNRHGIEQIQFDSVYNWLSGGGTLTFSNDSSRYYNAVCNVSIIPERISRSLRKLNVQFTVMPFRYALGETYQQLTLSGDKATVNYTGTYPSEPSIRVYGTGNLMIKVDGIEVNISDVSGFICIDVPTRRVYDRDKDDINRKVILNKTSGNFTDIRIRSGTVIEVNSAVTKVELLKNTRWR